jgi:DNA repair exonuclease SbcCD nuclease subunit
MLQIAHITDLHIANRPPENRIDNYNEDVFSLLTQSVEICRKRKIHYLAVTGDLSHSYKPDDELMVRFVSIVESYPELNILFVYGNHDVQGGNADYVHKTNFGLLERYKWFRRVSKDTVITKSCVITGIDYSRDLVASDTWCSKIIDEKKPTVLLTHAMFCDAPTKIIDGARVTVDPRDVSTNVDLVLCGHNHLGFHKPIAVESLNRKTYFVNPGSIGRVDYKSSVEGVGPGIAIIRINGFDIDIEQIKLKTKKASEVFDLSSVDRAIEKLQKQNFIEAMESLSESNTLGANFVENLKLILLNPPALLTAKVSEEVKQYCLEKLEQVM